MVSGFFTPGLLAGEVAVVTGGASGIGLGIATWFARHGCDVVITGRSEDRLDQAAKTVSDETGRACEAFACDVRDAAVAEQLREHVTRHYGTATILVNNAAANFKMPAARMTGRALSTVLDIDLLGSFNMTRAFVGDMLDRRAGSILNVVVPDPERGFPGFAHAGAAKAGVLSLTRSWAREWGPSGVRVNAIGPGPVPTEGVARNMLGLSGDRLDDAFAENVADIPLRRLGTPDDIASAATFLCSRAASWITGVSLSVDGGASTA